MLEIGPIGTLKFVILIFLLTVSHSLVAQRPIDSLRNALNSAERQNRVNVLNELAGFIKDNDPREAIALIDESLSLASSLKYEKGQIKSWLILATISSRESDFRKTDSLIRIATDLAIHIDDQYGLTSALLARGVLNIRKGEYDKAIQNHIDGLKAAEKIGDGDLMQTHTMNIGHVKSRLNLPEEADEYFLRSLKIAQDFGLSLRVGQVYLALGVSAYQRDDLESCIANYEKALPIFLKEEEFRSAGVVLNNLGYASYLKKEFKKANKYYDRSLKYRTQLNDQLGISRIWLNKARIAFDNRNYANAKSLNTRALTIAREIQNPKREMEVLEFMVRIYEQEGSMSAALKTLRTYNLLKDSVNRMANQQKVAELSARFEAEKKEDELNLAKQEVMMLEQKKELLSTRQFLLATVIVILVLTIAVAWVIQKGRVNRARANEKLAQQRAENESLLKTQLNQELIIKSKELKSIADTLARQNSLIQDFKNQLSEQSERRENLIESERIENIINFLERQPENYLTWQHFRLKFDENYPHFTARLVEQCPTLTTNELDISVLLKINLANKEMAQILNISYDAIKKSLQRMYRKMNLSTPEELRVYILKT